MSLQNITTFLHDNRFHIPELEKPKGVMLQQINPQTILVIVKYSHDAKDLKTEICNCTHFVQHGSFCQDRAAHVQQPEISYLCLAMVFQDVQSRACPRLDIFTPNTVTVRRLRRAHPLKLQKKQAQTLDSKRTPTPCELRRVLQLIVSTSRTMPDKLPRCPAGRRGQRTRHQDTLRHMLRSGLRHQAEQTRKHGDEAREKRELVDPVVAARNPSGGSVDRTIRTSK